MPTLNRPLLVALVGLVLMMLAGESPSSRATALEPPGLSVGEVTQGTWIEYIEIIGSRSEDPAAAIGQLRTLWERLDGATRPAGKCHIGLRLATDLLGLYETAEARRIFIECDGLASEHNLADERAYIGIRLGQLAARDGRDQEAINRLDRAISANAGRKALTAYATVLKGRTLLAQGKIEAAAAQLATARNLAREAGDIESLVAYLLTLADFNLRKGEVRACRRCHELALGQLDGLPPQQQQSSVARRLRAEVFLASARFLWRQFERESAVGALRNAFVYAEAAEARRLSASVWLELGQLYFEIAAFEQAGKMFDQARQTMTDAGYTDRPLQVRLATWKGRTAIARGHVADATNRLNEALQLLGDDGPQRLRTGVLLAFGELARLRGAWQDVLDYRRQAAEVAHGIGDVRSEIQALLELAATYSRLGNDQAAASVLRDAAKLAEAAGNQRDRARALTELSAATGELAPLVEAGTIARELHDTRQQARILLRAAEHQLAAGNPERAQTFAAEALTLTGDRMLDLTFHAKLVNGKVLLELAMVGGEPDAAKVTDAIRWLAAALKDGRSIGDPAMLADVYAWLGRAARLLPARADRALAYFLAAARQIETARQAVDGSATRTALLAQNHDVFSAIVDLQAKNDDMPAAFLWSESGKARTFLDQLAESRGQITSGIDPALLEQERSLTRQMAAMQGVRRELAGQADSADRLKAVTVELETLQTAFAELKTRIRRSAPAYASLSYPQPATVRDVQAALGDGEIFITWSLGPRQSHAFAITRDGMTHAVLPPRADIERRVRYARDLIVAGTPIVLSEMATVSAALGDTLLGPFRELIATHRKLVLAPDGVLSYLPFEALSLEPAAPTVERYGDIQYLIRHVESVRYVQSATVLTTLRAAVGNGASGAETFLFALGDPVFERDLDPSDTSRSALAVPGGFAPLPNTRREVEVIARIARDRGTIDSLLQDDATESALKQRAGSARYLHIATHGVLDERNPSFSGLVLTTPGRDAEPGADDGFLYLIEVFNMRLNAELVVLSACQTGLGRLVSGEGVEGLTRAFMYAGAPRVVVSLWSVDDASTATLMTAFYERLWAAGGSASPAAAMAAAKRQLIESGRFAAPYFWSPFVVIGRE